MPNYSILDLPGKQTSFDQGKTWVDDPNIHLQDESGNWFYVTPDKDPSNPANWMVDTMAGWHRAGQAPREETTLDYAPTYTIPKDAYPKSYSGILKELQQAISGALIPELQASITGLANRPRQYTEEAKKLYQSIIGTALKDQIPGVINNLANRGVLSSSVASDTLSDVAAQIALNSGTKGYEAAMQEAVMGLQVPQILGQLAGTTQYSEYADPSARERLMVTLLQNLM